MTEEPHEEHREPIAIPVPSTFGRLLEHAQMHDDHREMHRDALEQQIYDFIDGLSAKQASTLRRVLNMDQKSVMNQYYDGQLVGLLRYVHHVDPETGLSPTEELHDDTASS